LLANLMFFVALQTGVFIPILLVNLYDISILFCFATQSYPLA